MPEPEKEVIGGHVKIVAGERPEETMIWLNGHLVGRVKEIRVTMTIDQPQPVVELKLLPMFLETDISGAVHISQFREVKKDGVPFPLPSPKNPEKP